MNFHASRFAAPSIVARLALRFVAIGLFATVLQLTAALAQQPGTPGSTAAPVPALLLSAKSVFIANDAGDNTPTVINLVGGPNGIYDEFYAAVKSAGRFQIVDSPNAATLVFQIAAERLDARSLPAAVALQIYDSKTHFLLWTIREPIASAMRAANYRKNIQATVGHLVDDFIAIAPDKSK